MRAHAILSVILLLSSCGRVMTPAELARYETHAYPGRTKPQVFRATIAALRAEGYELMQADEGSGRVKTTPKIIGAHAVGSRYSAVATSTSFAWTVDVSTGDQGPLLHAEPRAYNGGQLVTAGEMNAVWLDRAFSQLYGEIEGNLPPKR